MHKQYHSDYYQAKIQLRPRDAELMKFVERQIEKRKDVWIAKRIFLKTGADYYISSNKFARIIGKKLKKTFKGELKESRKLFSIDRQSSKTLYRVTVCFRLKEDEDKAE